MPSILAVAYDTSLGRYLIQQLGSAQIADGAIIEAKIGAAAVTTTKIASGAVGQNQIDAGAVRTVHIYSGQITSAKLTATLIALMEAGVSDGGVTSAKIASGIVGSVHLADEAVASGDIKANAIATPHILAGGILSASIGANAIGGGHILDGAIAAAELATGAVTSAKIPANTIGGGHILDGSISESDLASGISIDIAEMMMEPTYRAEVPISGYLGIQFSVSGYFSFAQAADISSMPAIGITTAYILSGQVGTFQHLGRITNPGWDFSGYVGRMLFMGTSSQVTLMVSGLMVSGRCVQRIGKVADPDTVFLKPELAFAQIAA